MRTRLCLFALLLALVCAGCAKSDMSPSYNGSYAPPSAPPPPPAEVVQSAPGSVFKPAPRAKKMAERAEMESRGQAQATGGEAAPEGGKETGSDAQQPEARTRMVHYNGYARLRVTSPASTLDEAVALVTKAGGYVERLTASSVTLRVPVAAFQASYDALLKLGDVLSKSVTAEDVTEAWMSVDLRLRTSKETRDRLQELLARARTEREKLQLLREIQRLTQEIDQLESQIKTLESLASFSRITLEVVQREAMSTRNEQEDVAEFRWIQQLSPFRRDVAAQGKALKLEVPQGMVELDEKRKFIAESADGAVVWASERDNKPKGDTGYWLEAIKTRVSGEFGKAEVLQAGDFQVLRLVDRSDAPYTYLVGVRVDGDKLHLIEVYYPTAAHEQRYHEAVLASIRKGDV